MLKGLSDESVQSILSGSSNKSGFEQHQIEEQPLQSFKGDVKQKKKKDISFQYDIDLPSAIPLPDKHYSLEPDMIFGWVPKLRFNGPVNLSFKNIVNDQITETLLNSIHPVYKLVYLGFRPLDSIRLHQQYSSPKTYYFKYDSLLENQKLAHLMPLLFNQQKERQLKTRPFVGMNEKYNNKIKFDSNFEGGNLDVVVQVGQQEYDLFMKVDSNTRGHLSWFNFKVSGLGPKQDVKLNICNFTKSKCLYLKGMRPFIQINNGEWKQGGQHVTYNQQSLRYNWVEHTRRYYCLSFTLENVGINDTISVCYCVPYTYTKMLELVKSLSDREWVSQTKLCRDLSGIDVPLLTITDKEDMTIPFEKRKVVIIQARIHPGESNGSWMMDGFLQYLGSQGAQELRRKQQQFNQQYRCILKVIPMVNPDGVVLGNYRTGMAGRDLNREFIEADPVLYPTVNAIKQLVADTVMKHQENFIAFIDLHGHSVKKNVFIYGPEFSIWDPNYLKCRIYPKLLGDATEMFRYYSCIFRVSEHKKSTARGVFCDLHDIVNCFTIEASNGSYYDDKHQETVDFKADDWIKMGYCIGGLLDQLVIQIYQIEFIMEERQRERMEKRKQDGQFPRQRKVGKNKSKSINSANCLNQKRRSLTSQTQLRMEKMKEFQEIMDSTSLQKLFADIKKQEENKLLQPKEGSEGGSDSESSQDDYDDDMLQDLRNQILISTQSPDPKSKRKSPKPKQSKNQMSQKFKGGFVNAPTPPLPPKQEIKPLEKPPATTKIMSFGMSKKPLPTIIQNRTVNSVKTPLKQQNAYTIVTKHTHSSSHQAEETKRNMFNNLTQSYQQQNGTLFIHHELARPLTGFYQEKFESIMNVPVQSSRNYNNKFNSQKTIGEVRYSPPKNTAVIQKAVRNFQEEKLALTDNQYLISQLLHNKRQFNSENQNTVGYFSSKSTNFSPQNYFEQIIPERLTSVIQPKQAYTDCFTQSQITHFPTSTTNQPIESTNGGREKQFKSSKQPYPSAFYNMKKHLVNKRKPNQVRLIYPKQYYQFDETATPMIVRMLPTSNYRK